MPADFVSDQYNYPQRRDRRVLVKHDRLDSIGEVPKSKSLLQQVPGPMARIPSYRKREFARGRFLVDSDDLTLLDSIGQGLSVLLPVTILI